METIIIILIIAGFLVFLCIGSGYILTYDERQQYKLKKLEAVKRSELHEILKSIEHIDNVISAHSQTISHISQYVYQQEQKQLNNEKENKQCI